MIEPETLETELDDAEFEDDIEDESDEREEPFDPTKIRVDTRPMTIDLLLKRIEHGEIELNPDFQRRVDIWTEEAKSRLIESILIRIPIPAFYMDATDDEKWLVIDGLQRLSTLKQFVLGTKRKERKKVVIEKLKLRNLEFLTQFNHKNYDELPRNYQRRINETVLTIYLLESGTPPEVKFNIFRRINTGGEPLSPQELRHALNPGKATKFLDRLAKSKVFKRVIKLGDKREKRMEDHEFVLGFVAFYLTSYQDYNIRQGRDYFLNEAMKKTNQLSDRDEKLVEENFVRAMNAAFKIFGEQAFRKMSRKSPKNYPINKALFESWSFNLSQLSDREIEILIKYKKEVKQKFMNYSDNDKKFLISISHAKNLVKYRFITIKKIIQEVVQ